MNAQISISPTGEDMVIYYQISNPVRTINCGSDAIIQIQSITAAYVFDTGSCDLRTVINSIATKENRNTREMRIHPWGRW